jgi:competence protein ComEC
VQPAALGFGLLATADRPREHDLRLAVGAVAAWVVAALALSGGATQAIVLTVVAAAIGVLALAVHRRGRAFGAVIALAAFCVVLVLAPLAARLAVTRNSTLAQLARERTELTADVTLTSDPHPLAASGSAGSPRAAVEADVNSVVVAGRRTAAGGQLLILGPAGLWHDVLPGQRLTIDATVQPPLGGDLLTATLIAESGPQFRRPAAVVAARCRRDQIVDASSISHPAERGGGSTSRVDRR